MARSNDNSSSRRHPPMAGARSTFSLRVASFKGAVAPSVTCAPDDLGGKRCSSATIAVCVRTSSAERWLLGTVGFVRRR